MTDRSKITRLEDLKNLQKTDIVDLGDFDNGVSLIVEMKKPSLMSMIRKKEIPNPLMKSAISLFSKGVGTFITESMSDEKSISKFADLIEFFCEECFVTPKYSEIKELGIELTDEQLNAVLFYTQGGLTALENFRKIFGNLEGNNSSSDIQD